MNTREKCHLLLDELSDAMLDDLVDFITQLIASEENDDMEYCISLYDAAKAEDDGYRIDSDSLKAKYGI